jgi:heterodisulfide reductase subunit A-like polyferredoxin
MHNNKNVGAVLVVGGGVGGMQAALDLAESGYYVYLLEKEPSIGGVMAQLDKTFPTNDCAMCTLAPRLVEVGGHLNIARITGAEIESVAGTAGNFRVAIRQKSRYVQIEKCTGCADCTKVCPVSLNSEFDTGLVKRNAVYRRYPQAVPGAFAIDKQGVSPCRLDCPAGVNCHAYVALIAQRRFAEALAVERRENPFPAICGRICPHPCEAQCTRNKLDEPLAIAALKRFMADWEAAHPEAIPSLPEIRRREEKVAIVGAGPAGLTAARELALKGYPVTVFEAMPEAGGMLRYGIPEYRLPKRILQHEIQTAVLDLGVELRTNVVVGKDVSVDSLRNEGYKAFLVAIGAHRGLKLGIAGEDDARECVMDAVTFLRDLNLGRGVSMKGKVFVVGGGNAAMDAARTAVRMGADEVTVLYRRERAQMPANHWDIEEAEREGVEFRFLCAPVRLHHSNGKLRAVECVTMKLGEPDAGGRPRPVPIEDSEFTLEADWLISAISQQPELSPLAGDIREMIDARGNLHVDELTLQGRPLDVFAAGDAVVGPATAVQAIQAGKRAALSIDRYLNKQEISDGLQAPSPIRAEKRIDELPTQPRVRMRTMPAEGRVRNFEEIERGYTEEEAVAEAGRCLNCASCCECLLCVKACEAKAIQHETSIESARTIDVGAVVLAPGFDLYDAAIPQEFGFGRYPNVVSSIQLERMLSAGGPYQGRVLRSSDRQPPKRIAFIQCVGSRKLDAGNYCSAVCCMYATKQAIIAKEHEKDLECAVFFIDMRAFGKGFDDYYERAKKLGVRYIRCLPSRLRENPGTHNLKVVYQSEKNELSAEEFDMVVLSCGLRPPKDAANLARKFGIKLNEHGFCHTEGFAPVETSVPGVYVCGPFAEPKDIPETVMQACGAASKTMCLLKEERGTLTARKQYPAEKDVASQEPRIGVFVCHCGKNIGGVADVPSIARYAANLSNVVHAEDNLYTCSADTQVRIQQAIKEHKLNRVVVASCTPRTHERLFRDTCRMGGLNEFLFEMANIRDQNTWVHANEPDKATEKAKDLVHMAVAKSRLLEPLPRTTIPVTPDALVIGGGIAGMTSALELANQGFNVHLVEKEDQLGGNLLHIRYTLDGTDPHSFLQQTIERVRTNPLISVYVNAIVDEFTGFVGNFESGILFGPRMARKKIKHGAIIVATGAEERRPTEYMYGQSDGVLTQRELEDTLAGGTIRQAGMEATGRVRGFPGLGFFTSSARCVVMIQCVGSREPERPWCSRICCSHAVKNAIRLKDINPRTEVYILYRDIRTYGFKEQYYGRARERGVRFLRYDVDSKPVVEKAASGFKVALVDRMLDENIELHADVVALSTGIVPGEDSEELAHVLKMPLSQEKFFLEAHMKLRPVDFATDGIFMAGLCHWPKTISESIIQACSAASRAATFLSKKTLEIGGAIARVNSDKCSACLTCVRVCPYGVPAINADGVAEIKDALCHGCGTCASECPGKAIQLSHFTDAQVVAKCEAVFATAR